MLKKKKTLVLLVLLVISVFTMTITAFAATMPNLPYNSNKLLYINSTWKEIGSTSSDYTGMNCRIVVCGETQEFMGIDIKMTDSSGNCLWSQEDAISSYYPETFYCGPDVYKVWVRTDDPNGGYAWADYVAE